MNELGKYTKCVHLIGALDFIQTFKGVFFQLSLYVELQKEIHAFYPKVPDLAVAKCLKRISIKSSPDILTEVSVRF